MLSLFLGELEISDYRAREMGVIEIRVFHVNTTMTERHVPFKSSGKKRTGSVKYEKKKIHNSLRKVYF